MRHYYYLNHDGRIIRLLAVRKPKDSDVVWTAQEFDGKGWYYPVTSEITWKRLSKLHYIGSIRMIKVTGLAE